MKKIRALVALLLFAIAGSASAAVIYSFTESAEGVVGVFSGSIDTTGLTFQSAQLLGNGILPASPGIFAGPVGPCQADFSAFTAFPTFGPGGYTAGSSTGDVLGVGGGDNLCLAVGYVSGQALSGAIAFAGATFESLGVTPGTYVWTLPQDTITVTFSTVAEPGTVALLGLGLAGLALVRRRRSLRAAREE